MCFKDLIHANVREARRAIFVKIVRDIFGSLLGKHTDTLLHLDYNEDATECREESWIWNTLRRSTAQQLRTFLIEIFELRLRVGALAMASRRTCISHSNTLCGIVPDGRLCEYRFFVAVNPHTASAPPSGSCSLILLLLQEGRHQHSNTAKM